MYLQRLRRLRRHWVPIAIFIGFLLLYVITTVRGVSTADNAEFQWVGATLGLAHPPGFPLYTLLANGASRLPVGGSPAYRINLLSALTSALTLVFVYLATFRLTRNRLAGLVSVLSLGTATTFWAQATVANVRSLTALFAAIAFWVLILIYELREEPSPPAPLPAGEEGKSSPRFQFSIFNFQLPILFALTVGFGFTHHLSLAFIFLIMVIWLLWLDWRTWKWLPFGLFGLLPWLYLPWHSAELRTPTKFIEYALGLGFGGDFFAFSTPSELWMRAGVMLNVLTFQMNWLLLVAALIGLLVCWVRFRPISILLGGTFLLHTFITATYRAPQTVEYMLPAYVPLAICIGLPLSREVWGKKQLNHRIATLVSVLLIIVTLFQGQQRFSSFLNLRHGYGTVDYIEPILQDSPEGATVLSNWHWYTTLSYLQEVEGRRSDLSIEYVVPEGESYASNWAAAIEAGIVANRPTIATNFYGSDYQVLPPSSPIGRAFLWRNELLTSIPRDFSEQRIVLGEQIELLGFTTRTESEHGFCFRHSNQICVGHPIEIEVAWKPLVAMPGTSMFIHLVDEAGQIRAQDDVNLRAIPEQVNVTGFSLTPGSPYAELDVLFGAYLSDGTPLLNSDGEARIDIADLTAVDVGCYVDSIATKDTLLGHGIDLLPLPQVSSLSLGETVIVRPTFVSGRPVERDLAVNVTMVGLAEDGETWAWVAQSDSIPATGAIPTLKWIKGSRITDVHSLTVPPEAIGGQKVKAWLVVYDAFTNKTVPILDAAIRAQGTGIPLFELTLDQ